jgi:hypothetical protein
MLWFLKDAQEYADRNSMFFVETSAKTADNINQLFEVCIRIQDYISYLLLHIRGVHQFLLSNTAVLSDIINVRLLLAMSSQQTMQEYLCIN